MPPRAARACTFPAGSCALPEYHLSISLPFLLDFCPRTGRRRSGCRPGSGRKAPAQWPCREPRAGWDPALRGPRRPRPCTGRRWPERSRSPGPGGGCRAGPETTPGRRPPASSSSGHGSRPFSRARGGDPPATATEQHQWQRDVKGDTIRQHAEPPGRYGSCGETSCTGAPRLPGDLLLCPRAARTSPMDVKSQMPCSPLLRKPQWMTRHCRLL